MKGSFSLTWQRCFKKAIKCTALLNKPLSQDSHTGGGFYRATLSACPRDSILPNTFANLFTKFSHLTIRRNSFLE